MLLIMTCQCHGAEAKVRRVLRDAGLDNYMDYHCYVGKKSNLSALESLPLNLQRNVEWMGCHDCVEDRTSYAIVAGFDANNFVWQNVMGADIVGKARAEKIAETFA